MSGWRDHVAELEPHQTYVPPGQIDVWQGALYAKNDLYLWLRDECTGDYTLGFHVVIAYIEFATDRDLIAFRLMWADRIAESLAT